MQSTGGGGNGLNNNRLGGGLTRFRSAPATWLDALLETDEENDAALGTGLLLDSSSILTTSSASSSSIKQTPPISFLPTTAPSSATSQSIQSTQVCSISSSSKFGSDLEILDSLGNDGGGLTGLLRQNSSPAEFLSDGYFSGFGVSGNYDYLMPSEPSAKRHRDSNSDKVLVRTTSSPAVKIEQNGQLHGVLFDAEMDKLSEDAVLCKVRAKRGCATHPRSIAERVRRTRISDRIRKLQELVPNMDKQTNTADMLDEAVEYVMFLKKQIEELTEQQNKCKCFTKD